MTFGDGEQVLSQWMQDNAFVAWVSQPEPWGLEEKLIGKVSLPLNLDMNRSHPFHPVLSAVRREARRAAMGVPAGA